MTDEEYLERLKGLRVSSGKRPESLNQSRNVNAPLQLARGWTAGLLGLPGDIEGLVRMLPGIENETPVLPTSDFYREYLPGYDPAPAARAFSGLGALAGGVGATKVAGAGVRGAKAAGRALGPKAAEMAEGYLQSAGLAPSVIKPKGGNWLSGSVEKATEPLKTHQNPAQEVAYIRGELERPQRGEVYQQLVGRLPQAEREDAINNWIDTKLNKYIRNEMATPEDPVRKLAERGVTHMQTPPQPDSRGWVEVYRQDAGYPREGFGQSPLAKGWENVADEAIAAQSAGRLRGALSEFEGAKTTSDIHAGIDRTLVKERAKQLEDTFKDTPSKDLADEFNLDYEVTDANRAQAIEDWARTEVEGYYRGNAEDMLGPHYRHKVGLEAYDVGARGEDLSWLGKIPEDQPVYAFKSSDEQTLGFEHLIDELRNATRADSDLPANLRWKPEDLKKVTMEQAVERVAKINDWRAAQMEAAKKAAREGIPLHKEYEGGFQWMAAPDTAKDPKSLKYIQDVGCESGWCTQGESLARQYGGGGNQLYVLHDPNGKSVVQISVRPQAAKQGFVGNQRPSEADYYRLQEEWLEGNRVGTIDPNLTFAQWWRAKEGIPEPDLPPEIVEIKGRQNRPPKEEHLPMVQDFVRSGNWSRVGDLKNTGLIEVGEKSAVGQMLKQAGETNIPPYVTRQEYDQIIERFGLRPGFGLPQGYAKGGLVQDTDAIAAKLTGMDKDKALTHALRMANAKQEAHMAAGGLAKVLKGAKAAGEAAKTAAVVEKAAPVIPAAPRVQALEKARKNAIKAGQSPKEAERMLQQGYEPDWYHGTTGDIKALERERLGQATGAESAKKAFFFVRDPSTPPPEMLEKTRDPKSIDMMKKLGFSDEELAKLNEVSMKGHGAETASGYSQIGGSREYNEAMRKANAAERAGNWSEYEKWTQVAEDAEIGRNQGLQDLVAKYGEARDVMLDRINNAVLNKPLPQQEAEALDAKMKQLMPYGWYNSYSIPQLKALKGEIVKLAGPEAAAPALQSIDDFISVKANRMLEETYQEGSNVMPVALRYKNPMYYDFGGSTYRDQSYSDLIDQARAGGHDALIIKNTFDPGAGPAKLVDIGAVFKPEQVRSRFAAFDPARINENDILGAADPALLAGTAVASGIGLGALGQMDKRKPEQPEQKKAAGGLAKLLKGAKKTEEAAKASSKAHPTVFPPASPLTQAEMRPIAQRIAEQMTEEFVRPNPKLSKNPAGKTRKTFEREKDLPVETVQRIEPKPSPVMDYEQMQGGYLVGVPGDPTLGGVAKPGTLESVHQGAVELRRLGDVEFGQNPTGRVQLFGGPRYGSFADDEHFWASNLGPAQAIQNRATELGEFGPVYGQYIKMAPPSTNFAEHNLDALLAYQQPEKLSKSKMELLNKAVREGSPKYGKFPGFAGFEDPIDVLLQAQMNSDLRKHIAETLMKPDTTNALGLRPGSDVLFGISVPELRNLETGVSGYSIGKLEPGVELMPSLHPTYDYDIPGLFLGQSKYPVPYEVAFPRSTAYTRANLKPGAQEFNTLKMIGAREKIDPQYIDQIKMYEELMKEYTGKKEGGAVEPEGAEDFIRQVNAKIANKPVSAEDGYRIPY